MTESVAKAIPGAMTKFKLTELSGVTRGAQVGAKAVFMKVGGGEEAGVTGTIDPFIKRAFTDEARQKLADEGKAMPGGGFPIENTSDLENAIRAFGRAKDKDATKRHIIARAKALGASDKLPESWSVSKAGDPGFNLDGGPMSNAIKKALGLADTATEEEVTAAVVKLAAAEGREATAKLAKAEAKTAYLTLLSKARPKDKEQMKADAEDDDEPDADDEPDSPKAKKAIEFLSKSLPERDAIITKRESGDEVLTTTDGVSVRKSQVGDAVFAIVKSQEARIATGAEEVRKANEVNATMAFTKAATDDYGHLAGSIPEKVGVLRHMAKADEATRKAFDTLMKAAEATSKLAFTRMGHGNGIEKGDDPESKLDAMAKERMEKSSGRLTFEKAYDEVIREHPELYAQSVASKPVAAS